ncbi:PspC domain-containing protein [Runella sp.]|uniref:PspC domain-containing protein n=1 Tax=Runella sp. TaxID=1960881 RepID=UPI003D12BE0A
METNRLYRITNQSVIGGVAAGMAHHFEIDRALVRFLFVMAFFFTAGIPVVMIYIILWAVLPPAIKESTDTNVIRI